MLFWRVRILLVRDVESGPDGRSGIVGRAEDEERAKWAFAFEPGVGDTVEGNPAGVDEVALSGRTSQSSRESQDGLLGAPLQAGGDVREPLELGRIIGSTSRSEERLQATHIPGAKPCQDRIDQEWRPVLPARSSVTIDDAEETIILGGETPWVSIGGQAHDLAGIEFREAEIDGHPLPEHPDRVRVGDFLDLLETVW